NLEADVVTPAVPTRLLPARTRRPCPLAPGWGTSPIAHSAPQPGTVHALPLPGSRAYRHDRVLSAPVAAGRHPRLRSGHARCRSTAAGERPPAAVPPWP